MTLKLPAGTSTSTASPAAEVTTSPAEEEAPAAGSFGHLQLNPSGARGDGPVVMGRAGFFRAGAGSDTFRQATSIQFRLLLLLWDERAGRPRPPVCVSVLAKSLFRSQSKKTRLKVLQHRHLLEAKLSPHYGVTFLNQDDTIELRAREPQAA